MPFMNAIEFAFLMVSVIAKGQIVPPRSLKAKT